MTATNKYIEEIKSYGYCNGLYTDLMPIERAIDILQRFEVDLLKELEEEDVLKQNIRYVRKPE